MWNVIKFFNDAVKRDVEMKLKIVDAAADFTAPVTGIDGDDVLGAVGSVIDGSDTLTHMANAGIRRDNALERLTDDTPENDREARQDLINNEASAPIGVITGLTGGSQEDINGVRANVEGVTEFTQDALTDGPLTTVKTRFEEEAKRQLDETPVGQGLNRLQQWYEAVKQWFVATGGWAADQASTMMAWGQQNLVEPVKDMVMGGPKLPAPAQ